jgi:hypothetical protein
MKNSLYQHHIWPFITAVPLLVASHLTCQAGVTAQLDAQKGVSTSGTNVVWQSLQGVCLVGDVADWQSTNHNAIANVSGATAGPLVFTNAPHGATVRYMMVLVGSASELSIRETIACGPRNLRLDSYPANEPEGNDTAWFERDGFCAVESIAVNAVEEAELRAGRMELVEVDFGMDVKLRETVIGADWGRREWERGWRGRFYAMLLFDSVPPPEVIGAVRSHWNATWQLQMGVPRITQSGIQAAMNEGVHLDNRYGTLLLIK